MTHILVVVMSMWSTCVQISSLRKQLSQKDQALREKDKLVR